MDPILNPYSPGAGSPPPDLSGRTPLLEQARVLLGRTRAGRSEKSILLTGLRGVGKTVLLNQFEHSAIQQGYRAVQVEAYEGAELRALVSPALRRLLLDLERSSGVAGVATKALAALKGFASVVKVTYSDVTLGLDVQPDSGVADSGDLEIDLPNLFEAIGEAAREREGAVALLIDEMQYLSREELAGLIMAMHRVQQRQLPITLFGAGLPTLPAQSGEAKSYAERLFAFPIVGALSEQESQQAIQTPANEGGVAFSADALQEIYRLTGGYPYFLQEWAYQSWNSASESPISLDVVQEATQVVIPKLDANFFRVRYDRLSPSQKEFLRAMADLGPGPYRIGDVARLLNVRTTGLGPIRSRLIHMGMIYSPSHGDLAFTVPLFDEFMKREIPHLRARSRSAE